MIVIKQALSTISLLLIALVSWAGEGEKTPVPVKTHLVHFQSYSRAIRTSGVLAYKAQKTLSFKTAGLVESLVVEVGDRIVKGQLLASLALDEINAQVDEAEARALFCRKNLKRYHQLYKSNGISLDKLQSAETDLAVAESKLKVVRFNQAYSSIKADAEGLILDRKVEQSELVSAYQPVFLVADESQGWVIRAGIIDKDFARIDLNDAASVQFDALPGHVFQGKVTQMTPIATPGTGTFEIEITLPSSIHRLRSGFVGKIKIQPSTNDTVALIPVEALVKQTGGDHLFQQQATVFIYNENRQIATQKVVTLEYLEGGQGAISDGLQSGDQLITTGSGLVRDGDKVHIIKEVAS